MCSINKIRKILGLESVKTAEEMFTDLGFEKDVDILHISIAYRKQIDKDITRMCVFYLREKLYSVYDFHYNEEFLKDNLYKPEYESFRIDMDLHKAIDKQIEEWGWNNVKNKR